MKLSYSSKKISFLIPAIAAGGSERIFIEIGNYFTSKKIL